MLLKTTVVNTLLVKTMSTENSSGEITLANGDDDW
jgi:hypothetical protein